MGYKSVFTNLIFILYHHYFISGSTEQIFWADGTEATSNEGGLTDDTICCITCSDSHLLIGRDSGAIMLFSLLNFKKITSINMQARSYRMGLNSNSR